MIKQINIYDLFNEKEKEIVCEIVSEAISRTYGIHRLDDVDFDVVGDLFEEEGKEWNSIGSLQIR